MSFGLPWGAMYLVNAQGPAQEAADSGGMPVTVFYHKDYGYNFTNPHAKILKDRNTEKFVTWLPARYFEGSEQYSDPKSQYYRGAISS